MSVPANVVVIAAAGEATLTDELESVFANAAIVIAADGGLQHCMAAKRWPDLLVGDLDSARPAMVADARQAGVVVREFDADKDQTDLELAFASAVEQSPDEIIVVGAFGGRIDHELANVGLITSRRWPCAVRCVDGAREAWVLHGDARSRLELAKAPGTIITLLPWNGDATGVVTTGLRWPLMSETLPSGSPRGVSNECVASQQTVSLHAGSLLVLCS